MSLTQSLISVVLPRHKEMLTGSVVTANEVWERSITAFLEMSHVTVMSLSDADDVTGYTDIVSHG